MLAALRRAGVALYTATSKPVDSPLFSILNKAVNNLSEAEKEAMLLRAEAEKQVALRKAEAQAEAIRLTEIAKAEGIKAINAATPTDATLRVKAYDAFRDASHGEATKIIIPSDLQGIVGMASAVKSVLK